MGTFIITLAILSLCVYVFKLFWKAVLRWCYKLLVKAIDVIKSIIVAVKNAGKAVMYLYRRYKNGKITRLRVEPEEEEVPEDLLPEGLRNELEVNDEVIVKNDEIKPEEF